MERNLGHDFAKVRVHTGPEADTFTRTVDAAAVTRGSDLWFGAGRYRPDTADGRVVLAHELAHVIQQRRGGDAPTIDPGAVHERDASRAAIGAVLGRSPRIHSSTGVGVARVTPDEADRLIEQARRQMASEHLSKNLVGAAGEGSYRARLINEGADPSSVFDLNRLTPESSNFPHLDVASSQGFAQVKVRGAGAVPSKSALGTYVRDLRNLVDPAQSLSTFQQSERATKILEGYDTLRARGIWPSEGGVPIARTEEAVLKHLSRKSILAVPSDHVPAVQDAVRARAVRNPYEFNLEPGPNLDQEINDLVGRVHSAGLTRKDLGTLESQFRAGVNTTRFDLDQPVEAAVNTEQTITPEPPQGKTEPAGAAEAPAVKAEPAVAPETPAIESEPTLPLRFGDDGPMPIRVETPKVRVDVGDPEAVVLDSAEAEIAQAAPRRQAMAHQGSGGEAQARRAAAAAPETAPPVVGEPHPGTMKTDPTAAIDTPAIKAEPAVATTAPEVAVPGARGLLSKWGRVGGKWAGRGLAGYAAWSEYKRLRDSQHGTVESVAGGLGMGGGFLAAPKLLKGVKGAGTADLAINLANLGLNAVGAPRGVTDVSSTAASATPSSFIASVLSQGSRGIRNIVTGDTRGIDRQVDEMQKGEAGAPLQGYALVTELIAETASRKGQTGSYDLSGSIMKVGSKGQGSSAARIGDALGSSAWVLDQVGTNIAHGDSVETAIMKAPHLSGNTKWLETTGTKLGDEGYKFINRDLPEAVEFAKQDLSKLSGGVGGKVESAKQAVADAVATARAKGGEIKDEVVQGAVDHLDRAKTAVRKHLPSWLQ